MNERSFLDIKLHILNLSDSLIKNKVFGFVLVFFEKKKKLVWIICRRWNIKTHDPAKVDFFFKNF